jgi:hypothetical protein
MSGHGFDIRTVPAGKGLYIAVRHPGGDDLLPVGGRWRAVDFESHWAVLTYTLLDLEKSIGSVGFLLTSVLGQEEAGRGRFFRAEVVRDGFRFRDVWLPPLPHGGTCQATALAAAMRRGETGAEFETAEFPEFDVKEAELTAWHLRLPEPAGCDDLVPDADAPVVFSTFSR